ncbi:gp53-like domain-containing protein [Pseudomonas quasicaspiana]|uniref:gp53-like domain-containing protein n=1 Tax=Pseudomonas quasicaspiana TaxID=2829821 RepID=UPI001E37BDEB|nr:hypothetical protein [Pseudomonas quasicaspiana]MCD5969769.1 hypothetical protein [Pseudomonas quasicaspiana]
MDFPKSVPNVGLVDGRFVDESNVTGQVGSLITADWGNAMTSEIINVIEAAELVPTEGQNDQLVGAIDKLISKGVGTAATEQTAGIAKIATDADFSAAVADDTKMVTIQKIKAWFFTVVTQATERVSGIARVATQEEVNSGSDDSTIITPRKLRMGVQIIKSGNTGNCAVLLPTWLGSVLIQWGVHIANTADAETTVTFPLAFTVIPSCTTTITHDGPTLSQSGVTTQMRLLTATGFQSRREDIGTVITFSGPTYIRWIAVGY